MCALQTDRLVVLQRLSRADRKSLLLGTALASTLLLGSLLTSRPARAAVTCPPVGFPPPGPISIVNPGDDIVCTNVYDRYSNGGTVIGLATSGANEYIALDNSGDLVNTSAFGALGIFAYTAGGNSPIDIVNSGDITVYSDIIAFGIRARAYAANSPILIVNSGDIAATGSTYRAYGILAHAFYDGSAIEIANSGDISVIAGDGAGYGISARTGTVLMDADDSPIAIMNSGDILVTAAGDDVYGIRSRTYSDNSPLDIVNSGDIGVTTAGYDSDAYGILARPFGDNSAIDIANAGDIAVTTTTGYGADAAGILAVANGSTSPISIENSGDISVATAGDDADTNGILAATDGINSPVAIENSGDIAVATAGYDAGAYGISALTFTATNPIDIENSGDIAVVAAGDFTEAVGIFARTTEDDSPIRILNRGNVTASGNFSSLGIQVVTEGDNSTTTIINSGEITAASLFAIQIDGGAASIFNRGLITGFVDLTDNADYFTNEAGGTFEARLTSDFRMGDDLFENHGRVHTAGNKAVSETTSFIGLETFENSGTISLVDGREGDVFQIADSLGTDIAFVASPGSKLAVDAFLGPLGSTADNFIIDGNVSGRTGVTVNNTNPGPGAFNPVGIPVVFVTGDVSASQFFLKNGPIDSGLFTYDLFFETGAIDQFELRSFPGGGAHILPQLLTASQDIWYATSETWLDRTADLRVLLSGVGPANLKDAAVPAYGNITPGVWVRGSGAWLDRDDQASTSAYGRTYKYNLDRDLDLGTVQGGVDFGSRGVLSEGDALLFGILGGAVFGELTYDQLARKFDIDGGEVGGYVTYLGGGLYIDNLVKATFTEFDASANSGIPGLDSTVWGFRTDAGYRFGPPRQGAFVEPQATIAAAWTDMDNFTFGGNKVTFGDETDVRGRLGLRVGTSRVAMDGAVIEPFVVGSVWGDFSGDNKAMVTSFGTTFGPFTDKGDDVWGVVSGGLNVLSASGKSSAFAKVDYTFGDDIDGFGAKLGMRYNW